MEQSISWYMTLGSVCVLVFASVVEVLLLSGSLTVDRVGSMTFGWKDVGDEPVLVEGGTFVSEIVDG